MHYKSTTAALLILTAYAQADPPPPPKPREIIIRIETEGDRVRRQNLEEMKRRSDQADLDAKRAKAADAEQIKAMKDRTQYAEKFALETMLKHEPPENIEWLRAKVNGKKPKVSIKANDAVRLMKLDCVKVWLAAGYQQRKLEKEIYEARTGVRRYRI